MTEPDWTTAPSWAQWLTVNRSGSAWWWDAKPVVNKKTGCWRITDENYMRYLAGRYPPGDDWRRALKQRPEVGAAEQLSLFAGGEMHGT
jgi:hypothetical protein